MLDMSSQYVVLYKDICLHAHIICLYLEVQESMCSSLNPDSHFNFYFYFFRDLIIFVLRVLVFCLHVRMSVYKVAKRHEIP